MTHPARRRRKTGTDLVPVDPADGGRDRTTNNDWDDEDWDTAESAHLRRTPYVMGAVTAGVGASAWGCAQVAGYFAGPDGAATVETVTWMATAVSIPLLRSMFRHRIPEHWRTRWWLSTAAAAAWVDVAVTQGADLLDPAVAGGMLAALWLVGVWLGSRWGDECDLPEEDEVEDDEPEPLPVVAVPRRPEIDTSRAAEIEADWVAEVSGGRNPIARGAELQHRTHLPHGYRWLVQLDRAEHVGASDLTSDHASARVAFKLGFRATDVIIEPLEGDEAREDRVMLTVVTHDVLAKGVPYTGPNYDRGRIRIGLYADGTGSAYWNAYDDTGVQCGLVTGEQRSGKSVFMAKLAGDYKASGEWGVLVGDGDPAGGSSPLMSEIADDFAKGPREVLEQLEGLEAVQREVRGHLMGLLTLDADGKPMWMDRPGQVPADKMLPCPQFPGIVWFLDELHMLTGDPYLRSVNFATRLGKVVRGLAKYGVAVIIGTQSALGADFGGDSALRAMLAKNQVTMRTQNKSETGIVGQGGFDPGTLRKGGGYAFLGDGVRRAMVRMEWAKDMHRWLPEILARGVVPDELTWDVFRRYRKVRVLDREADYEERRARLAKVRAALATGAPLPGTPEAEADEKALTAKPAADAPMSFGGFTIPTGASNVTPIRRDLNPIPAPEPAPAPARLSDKALRVLAMLRTHPDPWTTLQLENATKLLKPDVSKALGELVKAGLAKRVSWGTYTATSISVQRESS